MYSYLYVITIAHERLLEKYTHIHVDHTASKQYASRQLIEFIDMHVKIIDG